MALAFGHGRHLLEPGALEEHFGLHATLNTVDRNQIRAVDRKRLDAIARHSREQASRAVPIFHFGLDLERDLLRSVTGIPTDSSIGKRVTGRDSLAVAVPTSLAKLRPLLERYHDLGLSTAYRKVFPEVGNIVEVTRKAKRDELSQRVVEGIQRGETERIWMAIPELLDWTDAQFGYAPSGGELEDIHLATYREHLGASPLSLARLRRDHVYCTSVTTNAPRDSWQVFRCLYAELEDADGTYLLDDGRWFRVNRGLVEAVNTSIRAIPQTALALPRCSDGESEDAYNARLAASDPTLALLHNAPVVYGGGQSRIEFCDLYSRSRVMVHVKRYGGSSVLSHLFEQGVVSAELLVGDAGFRAALNPRLPATHRLANPAERPNPADYEVAFVIATRSRRPFVLPLFSRITLRNAQRYLGTLGLKMTFTTVNVGESRIAA
jgi:uncharacterized protein (TIGR04141 family)